MATASAFGSLPSFSGMLGDTTQAFGSQAKAASTASSSATQTPMPASAGGAASAVASAPQNFAQLQAAGQARPAQTSDPSGTGTDVMFGQPGQSGQSLPQLISQALGSTPAGGMPSAPPVSTPTGVNGAPGLTQAVGQALSATSATTPSAVTPSTATAASTATPPPLTGGPGAPPTTPATTGTTYNYDTSKGGNVVIDGQIVPANQLPAGYSLTPEAQSRLAAGFDVSLMPGGGATYMVTSAVNPSTLNTVGGIGTPDGSTVQFNSNDPTSMKTATAAGLPSQTGLPAATANALNPPGTGTSGASTPGNTASQTVSGVGLETPPNPIANSGTSLPPGSGSVPPISGQPPIPPPPTGISQNPTPTGVTNGLSTPPPTGDQTTGQAQAAVADTLANPNPYNSQNMQQIQAALQGNLTQQFSAQQKALDEQMAARGIGASSISGGYYGDLAGQQANAEANMNAQLLQSAAGLQQTGQLAGVQDALGLQNQVGTQGLGSESLSGITPAGGSTVQQQGVTAESQLANNNLLLQVAQIMGQYAGVLPNLPTTSASTTSTPAKPSGSTAPPSGGSGGSGGTQTDTSSQQVAPPPNTGLPAAVQNAISGGNLRVDPNTGSVQIMQNGQWVTLGGS